MTVSPSESCALMISRFPRAVEIQFGWVIVDYFDSLVMWGAIHQAPTGILYHCIGAFEMRVCWAIVDYPFPIVMGRNK